ncbi:DUF1190 domain-containing protein [Aliiruegeria sabulilitoris]|uniref:DUF1190 domain-containing protein n=1 Tax=Aliiruegeria sabulilitoris TaxID=1510458 RepID=UPI00082F2B46|nr:DUF1190 domain-containing protein [Aliiruegeria sabulilitoris]NDR55391.1 DUF1190 domain-containing protein [Pseudoruegeria sp. M32A2M]
MTKRSKTVALCIVGAAAFTLSGCREEQVDAQAFPDLRSCKEAAAAGDGLLTTADCETAIAEAEQLHVETAPRYDSLEVCEAQHGEGACGSEEQVASGGSGSIFMPLLTGYLIGNMLSGRGGYARSQPMYRTADGKFTNASGSSVYSGNSGKAKLGANQFTKAPTTVGKPPMTKATAASRGGFGKAGGARAGYGG